ncbi:phenylacetate--CoA ligase [Photorhabdus sp. S14-60]|nr:phenylacetate--CoA ligase [Photorhabdus sp. S14-60]
MTIWTLKQIVALAQANSSPYRELYAGLSPESATLLDLPVLSHERLMEIVHNKDAIRFFNTDTSAGIIYQSSATTGKPKAYASTLYHAYLAYMKGNNLNKPISVTRLWICRVHWQSTISITCARYRLSKVDVL